MSILYIITVTFPFVHHTSTRIHDWEEMGDSLVMARGCFVLNV